MTSLTRVYRVRAGYEYELDEVEEMPDLLIYPDILLSSTEASGQMARRAIDEVVLRRGFQSLWTHPEEVVDRPRSPCGARSSNTRRRRAAAASGSRRWSRSSSASAPAGRSRLSACAMAASCAWVTNTGQGVGGSCSSSAVRRGTAGGRPWDDQRDGRVRLPELQPARPVELSVVAPDGTR